MSSMFMYDDVDPSLIPKTATAVAGYVDGAFANLTKMRALFPHAHLLTIAVFPGDDAKCLDVEPGDATNAEVYNWFKRQIARGVYRPVIYTSASNMFAMQMTMKANGFARSEYRMWSAHYTGISHLCGPSTCGYGMDQADATQFTPRALGRSLDESVIASNFFKQPAPPSPGPVQPATAQNPVHGIKAHPRYTQADVAWLPAQRAAGYQVVVRKRWTRRRVWTEHVIASFVPATTIHGLTPGKQYTVSVMATPATKWGQVHRSRVTFTTKK